MSEFNPEVAHGEVVATLKAYQEQHAKALAEIAKHGEAGSETRERLERIQKQFDQLQAQINRPDSGGLNPASISLAQRFYDSPDVKAFRSRGWHKGGASCNIVGEFDVFGRQRFLEQKTTITSATVGSSTPGILVPERVGPEIIKPPTRRVRVRDLIPRAPTSNNAVEYVQENVFTNAASPVAETISKAESALTFTIHSANVRTIAHWIPAARQVVDDFGPLEGYVNTRLIDGILDIEDWELLYGDNTGQHLNGLYTQATAYAGTYAAAGDTRVDVLAHVLQELEVADYVPDFIVLNPVDWRTITLIKTEERAANTGSYILGGPATTAAPRLWDIPIALTTAMRVGTYLVGQATGSAMIFDRMEARVDMSTEHDDYFIRNMVAIRAEERITLAVFRPAAFRYGVFA